MSIKEVLKLVTESTHTMVFLLTHDVSPDAANIGFGDGERTVASFCRLFSRFSVPQNQMKPATGIRVEGHAREK